MPVQNKLSRRKLLKNAALTGAAFYIVPRHVLGGPGYTPPSEEVNVAGIGAGGQGTQILSPIGANSNIVALCDVDHEYAAETFNGHKINKAKLNPQASAKSGACQVKTGSLCYML